MGKARTNHHVFEDLVHRLDLAQDGDLITRHDYRTFFMRQLP